MSTPPANVADLNVELKYELCTASAALFFNGICLLLFALAVFFLQRTRTSTSPMILVLAVVLVLFAVAQAVLDVGGAVTFLQVTQTLTDGGSLSEVLPQYDFYVRVSIARAALISVNNAITDSLLLYRCAIIWHLSPYIRAVIIFPSLLILSTLALGMWATFGTGTNIPFVLAMVTNLVLLGLTAGRIWIKARQATALLGLNARRYNTTLEIICESSLLYLVNVVVYLVANIIQSDSPVTGVAWGALAQVVNIVPMMLIVRVGMARNTSGEPDVNLRVRTSQAGHVGRFGKTNISDHDVTTPLTASRQYSEV